jgi:NADH-quinone oxidoreductase subunit L
MGGHASEILLAIGVAVPLVWFAILVFFGHRMGKPGSGWFAVSGVLISCILSTVVLVNWLSLDGEARQVLTDGAARPVWAELGDMPLTIGVKLDSLTVIMYFMVSFVSLCIFVFSVGYMSGHSDEIDGQSKYHRFFTYLCLFEFSMLGLVAASSLLFLFIFWELVGVCSYFLIGYYFDRKYASDAGIKAFVTNRVGDFGFIIGMMMVAYFLKNLDLEAAASAFAEQYRTGTGLFDTALNIFGWEISGAALATFMGVCLFCGAIGKSAQFPLQVWLPDAMAGPTPVSALIHAATMVAAGVYLVARIFRLLTPEAQLVIAVIGCITLTLMALVAIVQTDIKKVLAYSTLSQLGYMIFGMGVGAWIAALFHLMTHAFFKALLFLGSGQVIEGCHHEQDIRRMGGLRKKMPVTCWTFFVGVIAIAGVGIPWLTIGHTRLGVGGFFSKDEILAVAYERTYNWPESASPHETGSPAGAHAGSSPIGPARAMLASAPGGVHSESHAAHGQGDHRTKAATAGAISRLPKWLFWCPIIIAYVTPFYMLRVWWLTFMGKPRNEEVYHHAHEIKLMYVPLVVLSVGTFVCSYWGFRGLIADAAGAATDSPLVVAIDGEATHADVDPRLMTVTHGGQNDVHANLTPIVGFAFLVGFAIAYWIYRNGLALAHTIAQLPVIRYVYVVLVEKLFFDHLYNFVLVKGTTRFLAPLCRWFDGGFDRRGYLYGVVDRIFNLSAAAVARLSFFTRDWLDVAGVDGVVNGIADSAEDFGDFVRQPQTGRIRNYLVIAAGTATAVILCLVLFYESAD